MRWTSASCQLAYWQEGQLRVTNYLTHRTFSTNAVMLDLMHFFAAPRTIKQALSQFGAYHPRSVASAILKLINAQLLLEHGSAAWQQDRRVESVWRPWLPEGGFHFMTKDIPYIDPEMPIREKVKLLPRTPPPAQFKTARAGRPIRLSRHGVDRDTFFQTLHARRTHREFTRQAVSLEQVSKLLQTTWGVQGFLDATELGTLPYKTSPSGGSRHPGEVYLVALRVNGLERGIYHYQPNHHRLARIPGGVSARRASAYCAGQRYFGKAAALFIMTAVFARTMWKYRRGRAYRVILLETGHLCQTFCLTATRLGLAPFSTAALEDSLIEQDLGIDGISESVLYVAGIGRPVVR